VDDERNQEAVSTTWSGTGSGGTLDDAIRNAIYSKRFAIPNFLCRHTAQSRASQIDWERGGELFTLGAFDSSVHDVVSVPYGEDHAWALARDRNHVQRCVPTADPLETRPGLDGNEKADDFIYRLNKELRINFPRGYEDSPADLGLDFGVFLVNRSRDSLVMRAKFQLLMFNKLSKRR
jgi:hypothetical protein